jgi:hypothetical protein
MALLLPPPPLRRLKRSIKYPLLLRTENREEDTDDESYVPENNSDTEDGTRGRYYFRRSPGNATPNRQKMRAASKIAALEQNGTEKPCCYCLRTD